MEPRPSSIRTAPPPSTRFAIRRPEVVSEVFDSETVVVDLTAGRYYAFNSTATAIWSRLTATPTADQVATALAPVFGDLERARGEVAGFLERLAEAGLLVRVATGTDAAPGADPEPHPALAGEPPPADFEVYTDLEDLLVLDPIHDLDESGWPSPLAKAAEAGE